MQRLGHDDRALRLAVDVLEQPRQPVGGEEQRVRLVVGAVDGHADAVQQRSGGDHDLGVALLDAVVGDDARHHAAPEQQPRDPQRDVRDDLDVDPAVVGHAQPLGGVDGRRVPERLDAVVGVDRVQQLLELAVAARGDGDARLGDGLAQGLARPGGRSRLGGGGRLGLLGHGGVREHELLCTEWRSARSGAGASTCRRSCRSHALASSARQRSIVSSRSARRARVLDRRHQLDALVEVARHQVGRADVVRSSPRRAGSRRSASARGSARRPRSRGCCRRRPRRPGAGSRCRAR